MEPKLELQNKDSLKLGRNDEKKNSYYQS